MVSAHIAWYLFLAGMGGAAFAVGALVDFGLRSGEHPALARASTTTDRGLVLGPLAVLAGSVFLLADLGSPEKALGVFCAPPHGILGWGAWAVAVFVATSAASLVVGRLVRGKVGRAVEVALQLIATGCGLFVVCYSGVYLSLFPSVPFLNSPLVPCLFVASAFSTALWLLAACGEVLGDGEAVAGCVRADLPVAVIEALLLAACMGGAWLTGGAARLSAEALLTGEWAGLFWVGVVGGALVLPLAAALGYGRGLRIPVLVGAAGGLAGGLCLRYALLLAALRASSFGLAGVVSIWG